MLISLTIILAGTWAGFAILLYITQDQLIFYPAKHLSSTPDNIGLLYEDISLSTPDRMRLHGWYIPAENPRGVLLFLHGNAGNISHRLASLEIFNHLGLSTLIIDYRGYGNSTGSPSEQGTYTDAETAWEYLVTERGHEPGEVILFGRSLGAAVATWLATQAMPAGIILESAFTSLKALAKEYYPYMPVGLLLRSRYSTEEYLVAANVPSLIIHSEEDEIIPYKHAESLLATAGRNSELHTIRGGHNEGFLLSEDSYIQAIRQFTDKVLN
ncbi:MAG: alpha/beta hydrolase [Gammaproteobacteria bacterium]|nr:alpha/beta hydrolase [Gammaproteobacteria bacterium]